MQSGEGLSEEDVGPGAAGMGEQGDHQSAPNPGEKQEAETHREAPLISGIQGLPEQGQCGLGKKRACMILCQLLSHFRGTMNETGFALKEVPAWRGEV